MQWIIDTAGMQKIVPILLTVNAHSSPVMAIYIVSLTSSNSHQYSTVSIATLEAKSCYIDLHLSLSLNIKAKTKPMPLRTNLARIEIKIRKYTCEGYALLIRSHHLQWLCHFFFDHSPTNFSYSECFPDIIFLKTYDLLWTPLHWYQQAVDTIKYAKTNRVTESNFVDMN